MNSANIYSTEVLNYMKCGEFFKQPTYCLHEIKVHKFDGIK